jgi:DNA-binding CsgD family transcriptional regulator
MWPVCSRARGTLAVTTPDIDFLSASWDDATPMLALSESRAPLLGRETELQFLTGLLDNVERSGAALVLRGEPGIGGEPQWEGGGDAVESLIAGMRGDEEAAERAAARAEQIGVRAQALAHRRSPRSRSEHRPTRSRPRPLAEVESVVGEPPETWVAVELRYARAILATDPEIAAARFEDALSADLARWPFQRARLLLAYGRLLRRERRVTDSRDPLRGARDIFDRLGCASWGDQARRELRASGERSRRRDPSLRDQLTAQELQVAQLAAEGLSNREIAQKLFVSPRTVSTHLYRIYPKLGISARNELATALSATA